MKNEERRLEGRFLCADVVRLTFIAGEQLKTLEAVLEDIAPPGACVQVDEEVPPGIEVELTAAGKTFCGLVSYCVYRDYGYFVGIHFLDETHWSKGAFLPDHLTDLQALAGKANRQL